MLTITREKARFSVPQRFDKYLLQICINIQEYKNITDTLTHTQIKRRELDSH